MRTRSMLKWAVAASVTLLLCGGSPGSDEIYVYLPGIPGNSTDLQHLNWIECSSVTFGSYPPGVHHGLELGHMVLVKAIDSASPLLSARVCDRQLIPWMLLDVKDGGSGNPFYFRMAFSNVLVWSVSLPTSNAAAETVRFEEEFVQWTYTTAGAGTTSTYADTRVNRAGFADDDGDSDGQPDMVDDDDDNDTMTDRDEFWAGSNPTDPDSVFRVRLEPLSVTNGLLSWSSAEGRVYDIWRSVSVTGSYTKITSVPVPAQGSETSTNVAMGASAAFFHVTSDWP